MDDKKSCIMLFLLPLLLALFYLNEGLFHYDAIVLAQAVEKTFETKQLQPAVNGRYGAVIITAVVYFPFWLLGQNADLAVLLTSAIFYAASIPAVYLFIRTLFGNQLIGVYAAALFAATPIYLSPNTFGKEHGMALFFVFSAFYLLLRGLQKGNGKILAASAAALIISHTVREATLFFLPFYLFLAFFTKAGVDARQRAKCVLAPYAICFLILYLTYFGFVIQKTFFPSQAGTAYLFPRPELRKLAFDAIWQTTPITMLTFAAAGIFFGMKKKLQTTFVLAMLLTSFVFFANISTFAARYLDVFMFALAVLAAVGLAFVAQKSRIAAHAITGYLCISSLLIITPILSVRSNYNGQMHVGQWIAQNTTQDAVIITQDDAPFITYYGRRQTIGPPTGNLSATIEFVEKVSEILAKNTSVYLTISGLFDDPEDINKNALPRYFEFANNHSILSEDFHNAEIRMQRYYQIIWELKAKNNTRQSHAISIPFHND